MMGCGWWNPPTPYKEDCYWYREEQDMNAHISYCLCNNKFPLDSCENCENYHSRSKRTQGDRIRSMSDEQLADFIWGVETEGRAYGPRGRKAWIDWLKQEETHE